MFVSSRVGEQDLNQVKAETQKMYQAVQDDLMQWVNARLAAMESTSQA